MAVVSVTPMITTSLLGVVVVVMTVAVAKGVMPQRQQQPAGTLVEEMQRAGASTALSLLRSQGMDTALSTGFYTLFVPTNAAFQQLPQEWQIHLNVNASARTRLLQYHALPAIFRTQDAFDDLLLNTTLGQQVRVNVYGHNSQATQVTTVEGARIVQGDITATNGYLHLVDRVLLPPGGDFYDLLVASPELSSFKALVDKAGLQTELSDYQGTLLAPSNDAFTALITTLGQARYNNLVHNHESLRELVLYHMVERVLFTAGAVSGSYVSRDMANTLTVTNTPGRGGVMQVQNATVTQSDVAATNGVMQVLDSVLIPPSMPTGLVGK